MEFLAQHFPNLTLGFSTAVSPINLMYCFIGVMVGTLVGVLPGIGPAADLAIQPRTATDGGRDERRGLLVRDRQRRALRVDVP